MPDDRDRERVVDGQEEIRRVAGPRVRRQRLLGFHVQPERLGDVLGGFLRTVGQIPLYYNHRNTGRPPSKDMLGIPLGTPEDPKDYVSTYLDADFTPQYPFGYGLSYSRVEYQDLKLSSGKLHPGEKLSVSVQISNTGQYPVNEVVQLYIHDRFASVTRPVKELKGFQRIALPAGESRNVVFTLSEADLAFWNIDMKFTAEAGMFEVMVGRSSADEHLLKASFELVDVLGD